MTSALRGEVTVREPTRAQQAIARRAAEARATIPDVTVDAELHMDAVLAVRGLDPTPEIGDFIVKACGLALREFPRVNAAYRDGRFELYSRVNIGIAVMGDGFISTPTILDADVKTVHEIASESRLLGDRVRAGEISPAELAGSTFTVADLGMHRISTFQPLIPTSHAAALGLGAIRSLACVEEGRILERTVLTASMSCDHRIVYPAEAAAFLGRLGELVAKPAEWAT